MTIQERYDIGKEYLYTLRSPNGMVQDVGTISEYGITEDHIAYIKVEFGSTVRKFMTNGGKPVYRKEEPQNVAPGEEQNLLTAAVPA